MIDSGSGAPTLTSADIVGGKAQVNEVRVRVVRFGVHLLYTLRVNTYPSHSDFVVEAFNKTDNRWYRLWQIPARTYHFPQGRPPGEATDPASAMIASPNGQDDELKAASWQKIIDVLTREALALLEPPWGHEVPQR
ncbi:hypothetical protein IU450_36095 [Nocardia abscessus]|uniref:hypothetical protein n=1 Tax=Nocardia abscessus TaxID=120957 RepID=UPI001895B0F4|nr:hypothetical protein [Nocardia abscessus]MBF6341264.1 hypothetical protein [Nocardia abscessus]